MCGLRSSRSHMGVGMAQAVARLRAQKAQVEQQMAIFRQQAQQLAMGVQQAAMYNNFLQRSMLQTQSLCLFPRKRMKTKHFT